MEVVIDPGGRRSLVEQIYLELGAAIVEGRSSSWHSPSGRTTLPATSARP
jgi:hypothetical protein